MDGKSIDFWDWRQSFTVNKISDLYSHLLYSLYFLRLLLVDDQGRNG
jgi:hypothetical protein